MELLIVLGIAALAVCGARWLIVQNLDRERVWRRLEEWVAAPPKEPK